MKIFQQSLAHLNVKCIGVQRDERSFEANSDTQSDFSEEECTDPSLTLNLLRQNNENEIRSGSAKLIDRKANEILASMASQGLSHTGSLPGLNFQPQQPVHFPTAPLGSYASQASGLSLKAAPFRYSEQSASHPLLPAKELRGEKQPAEDQFRLDMVAILGGRDTRTTVMIRNIPNKYTQKMLLGRIDARHQGKYDFFYLPIDLKNNCNVGYAFINMSDPSFIVQLYEDLAGKKLECFNSEKICELTYGRIQGKEKLVDNFQSAVDLRKVKPAVFESCPATQAQRDAIRADYFAHRKF